MITSAYLCVSTPAGGRQDLKFSMETTKQKTQGIAFMSLLLWLVCASLGSFLSTGVILLPWLSSAISFLTLFCYIFFAVSFSRILIGTVFQYEKRAKVGVVACACCLVLLYLVRDQVTGSLVIALLQSFVLLTGATLLGTLLSTAITRIGELVPLVLTAATADVVSVFCGPTRDMGEQLTAYYGSGMEGAPPLVDLFLLKAVAPGGLIQPLFGVSDWILMILLSSALLRLERSDNLLENLPFLKFLRASLFFPVTAAGLYVSLLAAGLLRIYVPALFFICLFFLLFLVFRCEVLRHLQSRDLIYALFFPVTIAGLILLLAA